MRNIDVTIVKIRIFNISPLMPALRFSNTQVDERLAAERRSHTAHRISPSSDGCGTDRVRQYYGNIKRIYR